jgi:pimeloyl-ACP methyl ester carboxylesterase
MRLVRRLAVMVFAVWTTSVAAEDPARTEPAPEARGNAFNSVDADVAHIFRYEPSGLSLRRHFERGKIPVVFVHGLWSNPLSWSHMIERLEADSTLRARYQFWTFGYSTGNPIPYSAQLLRRDLDEARTKFDPDRSDRAFDRMVMVGHSMGGLLTKMMVQESGTRLWHVVSDRPVEQLAGDHADRALLRRVLIYRPRPELRRVVFINTPHRGSRLDQSALGNLGSRLVRLPDPLRASHNRLIAANAPDFFTPYFRKGLPTSVHELEWQSPFLLGIDSIPLVPSIEAHSIISDRRNPPKIGGSDGLVEYESAHLEGTASELLVSSGHLCQDNPAVIREIERILAEHNAR